MWQKAREPAELARLDAEDTLGNEPRQIRKRARADGADLGELSADDDDAYVSVMFASSRTAPSRDDSRKAVWRRLEYVSANSEPASEEVRLAIDVPS